ncbi:MAG: hypothetical protein U0792_20600 [Gemmataceae bacterium]
MSLRSSKPQLAESRLRLLTFFAKASVPLPDSHFSLPVGNLN